VEKMQIDYHIPEPFQFNPLKHHFAYIKEFISIRLAEENLNDVKELIRELKHIGTSVMDIYTGEIAVEEIFTEINEFLKPRKITSEQSFGKLARKKYDDYLSTSLSDGSQWVLKYHNDKNRYVHIFPARNSLNSFRVKANTLKSAILYYILIGKDYITKSDLNRARSLLDLSPIKDPSEVEAITKMIEILRK
jgi:hypothetical protein